eukprot:scaffold34664_cov240-Amphora_coffeaeformis.AAC.3
MPTSLLMPITWTCIKILILEYDAKVEQRDMVYGSAVNIAAKHGHLNILKLWIMEFHADVTNDVFYLS